MNCLSQKIKRELTELNEWTGVEHKHRQNCSAAILAAFNPQAGSLHYKDPWNRLLACRSAQAVSAPYQITGTILKLSLVMLVTCLLSIGGLTISCAHEKSAVTRARTDAQPATDEKREFFDRMAKEETAHEFSVTELAKVAELIPQFGLKRGDVVVEAGCGTGRLTPHLLEAVGPSGKVYGIDFAPEMIEVAKRRGLPNKTEFIVADVVRMPLESGCCDAAVLFAASPHFVDKEASLLEINRVLKPHGKLLIAQLLGSKELNELHRSIGGPVAHDAVPDSETMKKLLSSTGFVLDELVDRPDLYFLKATKSTH